MKAKRKGGTLALLLILTSLAPSGTYGQRRNGTMIEDLSFEESGDALTLTIRTNGSIPRFVCRLPTDGSREMVVSLPDARARTLRRYEVDGELLQEAFIEEARDGAGVQVRVMLLDAELGGIEQIEDGLVFRFITGRSDDPSEMIGDTEEYRIGVGDRLQIAVYGHEDLTTSVHVRQDGTITFPLIGSLRVAQKTLQELDADITEILGRDFLVDPEVSVEITEYQSRWVTIIGEVRNPGRYVLGQNMRLIDLLALAGGANREAGREIIITRRRDIGDSSRIQISVDRAELLGHDNQEANLPLSHGDIVMVSEQELFFMRGQVNKPGPYYLAQGMTILRAVGVAGGLTQFANRKDIELIRTNKDGLSETAKINLKAIERGKAKDIPLQPGDIIIVPRRIF